MNDSVSVTDQWKLDGDCEQCRRQNYCSNSCSAHNKRCDRRTQAAMKAVLAHCAPSPAIAREATKWL